MTDVFTKPISSTKRLRVTNTNNDNNKPNVTKRSVYDKILCGRDTLRIICYFMSLPDLFGCISIISSFHCHFLTNYTQSKLIYY